MVKTVDGILFPENFGKLFIASRAQLGGIKCTNSMEKYIFGRRDDEVTIFNVEKTWEKLVLAARVCAAIKNPASIVVVSGKAFGRKPVLKFAEAVGSKPCTGRFVPGLFTNSSVRGSIEPRLLVVSDPVTDQQAIMEAARVNCPVIAFCNTDADLSFVDIAIPINNRSPNAIGVAFFILSRLFNYMKNGAILDANIKEVELFFFRDAAELESLYLEQNGDKMAGFAEYDSQDDDKSDYGQEQAEVYIEDSGESN
ncbi:small subunit ribosomal protein SAe [Pancytospora epiphaga]|nr:small subunit ribosomal protein SAe [Pancytospora epiphaga]